MQILAETDDVVCLRAIESEGLCICALRELEGQNAHADEVGAVDALVAGCNDRLDTKKTGSLGCPVPTAAGAVFLPGQNDERDFLPGIFLRCIKDAQALSVGLVEGLTTLDTREHEVLDADIGKGATGHDAVIATAAAIAVEVFPLHAMFAEEASGRGFFLDGSGGRNVVGGHGITEDAKRSRSGDRGDGSGLHPEVFKEGGLLDISALSIPLVDLADRGTDLVPFRILSRKVTVEAGEHLRRQGTAECVADLGKARPDVAQEDLLAIRTKADRFDCKVNVNPSGKCEGNDQRGGHQKVCLDVLVDARLEIPVAGEYGGCDQIVVSDGLLDLGIQRAGVADTGGAAVADSLESECVEVGLKPRLF